MTNIEKLKKIRLKKLENLRKTGINPYPAKILRTHTNQGALGKFNQLSKSKKKIILVGRQDVRHHQLVTVFSF